VKAQTPFAPGPCPFEQDDGAYILGALAPADRAEFERHLPGCPPCRDSMAQLAVLPGLLGRLNPDTAAPAVSAPPSLLPRVLAAVRAQRAAQRRRRVLATLAGALAAAAVAAVVGIGVQVASRPSDADVIVFSPMNVDAAGGRVEAEIGIAEEETGTQVTVRCLYHGSAERSWEIWLVVYTRDDEAEPVGSWVAVGETPVEVTAITHHSAEQIARIELQTTGRTTVAWWTP
jgi:anti-sigma factor RsiW